MRRLLLAAAAVIALSGPLSGGAVADTRPAAPVITSQDDFMTTLAEGSAALEAGDRVQARQVLERAWRSPAFAEAKPEIRYAMLLILANLASEARDWPAAKAAIAAASEMPIAEGIAWVARLEVASYGRDSEDAVHALTQLAKRFPTALTDLADEGVFQTLYKAWRLPDGEAKRLALTDALFKAGWTPQDPFTDLSDTRMGYVRGLIRDGRLDEAKAQAGRITLAEALLVMRADKRFDALGPRDKASLKAGALARLAEVEALLPKHADRMSGQIAKAEALMELHRAKEALVVIDAAIAHATATPDALIDYEAKLGWAHNVRNAALEGLGRREEAQAALEIGARVPEHGQQNVNQTLNLAITQVSNAQPKGALATVATVRLDRMSPYGRAVALQAKACAHAALNDRDAALAAVKDLRAIGDEAKGNTLDALLCLGDLEGAAALVIERLAAEDLRGPTLLMLQDTPPPDFPTAYGTDRRAKLATLRQRPDVVAAVERVGRIEHYRPEDLWPTP
ncbi:hypothetical protein [Caulobacter segnis]